MDAAHQDWVPDEEDGRVVSNKIPVSILSIKLHGKSSGITDSVCTSRLTTCEEIWIVINWKPIWLDEFKKFALS